MKKRYYLNIPLISAFMLLFTVTFGMKAVQAQTETDLATNGSFADFELGELLEGDLGWTFNINGGDPGALAFFDIIEDAQDGDGKALKIDIGPFNNGDDWNVEAVNEDLAVRSGVTYKASMWIKADSADAIARLYFGLPATGNWARYNQTDFEVTNEWQEYSLEYTASAVDEANMMRFSMAVNLPQNDFGVFYLDNFTFVAIDSIDTENMDSTIVNVNGGFESSNPSESTSGTVAWSFTAGGTGAANFALVEDEVKDGALALKVNVETLSTNSYDIQAINTGFEVEPNVEYTYSIWAKSSDSASVSFTIGNAEFEEFARLDQQALTTEWQEYIMTFQVGENNTQLRAPIHLGYAGNETSDIYIDELVIRRSDSIINPIADGGTKFLGNVYSSSQAPSFADYWNQVTPENAGKWGSVEGSRDVMNWFEMDNAAALAEANGFPLRFHVLVWGNQQPQWMKALSATEQMEELTEWMEAVAERYPQIEWIEVVNEPLHDPPHNTGNNANDNGSGGYFDALGGDGETGWDWVINSFQMARDIFPNSVKLMMNDYSIMGNSTNTTRYLEIINLLKDRNLIDGIGVQGHAFSTKNASVSGIRNSLDRLAATGLPIQVTELEIDGNPLGTDEQSDQTQLEEYQRIFPTIWEHEGVEGITMWGWRTGLWRTDQEAFIIRQGEVERPALTWLREYVTNGITGVSNEEEIADNPNGFKLSQNYPNPFNPTTQIEYQVPASSNITINVYDITGRLIQTLVNEVQGAGSYSVNFNASALSTGMYFYELRSDSFREVKKMMLIK